MLRNSFGRTDLRVSQLCLGTQSFGWKTDEPTSFAILDAFHAAGGNFVQATATCPEFPLAPAWGGLSESHLGRWMHLRQIRRRDLMIATRLTLCRGQTHPSAIPRLIRSACEGSLRRLGTDYLDVLVLEWSEGLLPLDESFSAIAMLVRAGLLRYGAVSGFPSWRVADLVGQAKRSNIARPEAVQIDYSLLHRGTTEVETRELVQEYRLALLARSPLARGRLAPPPAESAFTRPSTLGRTLEGVSTVARARGTTAAQVALAWVLAAPEVTSAVIGPRNVHQLRDALAATALQLTPAELARLDDLSLPSADIAPEATEVSEPLHCSPVRLLSSGCQLAATLAN